MAAKKQLNGERKVIPPRRRSPTKGHDLEMQEQQANSAVTVQRVMGTPASALRPVDILTLQQTVGNRAIQRVLADPVSTDYERVKSMSRDPLVLGYTFSPYEPRIPDFDITTAVEPGCLGCFGQSWTATLTKTENSDEGIADAFYTKPYKNSVKVGEGSGKDEGKGVYLRISSKISDLARQAEQEHVNDHRHAYDISLKEADAALTQLDGHTYGPKSTKAKAEAAVYADIRTNLTHEELGADKTKWAEKYEELYKKSDKRDDRDWHSFGVDNRREKDQQVTYDIVKGETQIGNHPSEEIIKYE